MSGLGTVAPAGQAGNNGLSHLHIAAHASTSEDRFGATLPLAGAYAIEGVQLPPITQANGHAGQVFRSSNQLEAAGPPIQVPSPAAAAPQPEVAAGTLAGFTSRGAGLAVVVGASTTQELLAGMAAAGADVPRCTVATLAAGAWVSYLAAAPAAVNDAWTRTFPAGLPPRTPIFTRCT